MSHLTATTCEECRKLHGTIYPLYEPPFSVLLHPHCQCIIVPMRTKKLGHVTKDRWNGADVYIACLGKLPDNYVDKQTATKAGWRSYKGNLNDVLPGISIGRDVFNNRNNRLPSSPGRIWYEADIDYESGYRNDSRIVYSNDGLIFAHMTILRLFTKYYSKGEQQCTNTETLIFSISETFNITAMCTKL